MKSKMRRNENIALLPGGFQEATLYQYGKHIVYIKKRKVGWLSHMGLISFCHHENTEAP